MGLTRLKIREHWKQTQQDSDKESEVLGIRTVVQMGGCRLHVSTSQVHCGLHTLWRPGWIPEDGLLLPCSKESDERRVDETECVKEEQRRKSTYTGEVNNIEPDDGTREETKVACARYPFRKFIMEERAYSR